MTSATERQAPTRVLLVDDDAALLDALSEALRIRTPQTICDLAGGAAVALERLAASDYDAVISDIKMPGTDGLQLLALIRERWPEIPVLLITGHGETDLAIQALRAGAYDLLQKPLDRDYLINALGRAVETRRLRGEVEANRRALEEYAQELERRVEERTSALKRANSAKDEFLSLVSHELRTPITVILGNAEVLISRGEGLDPDSRNQALKDLQVEARRLQRIVENLLVLARLEHATAFEREPVLLREVIAGEVRAHKKAFPRRSLDLSMPEDTPLVLAEPTHIELILRNLLSNAEKYSQPSEPIDVEIEVMGSTVAVRVLDRGHGISREDADRLFTAFFRSPDAAQMATGIGIGLAVCRRLVEVHGGQVWAYPRAGGGSEFGFSLPVLEDVAAGRERSPSRVGYA